MKGYLLNFFKYAAVDSEDFDSSDQWYLNAHDGEVFVRSVVWSVFDRLEIREINSFKDFRVSQYSEKKWVGERQFSLIYEINPGEKKLVYKKSNDKCRFAFHKLYNNISEEMQLMDERKYRFFGISMVDLTPEMHSYIYSQRNPGEELYKVFGNAVDELCRKNQINTENICYELYGTLGGNDLVIIWLANEYKDVVTVIEALRMSCLKRSNRPVVSNISTIMGLRDINDSEISYDNVDGELNIRFTKKGTYNHKEFKAALETYLKDSEIEFETTLGEHDLSLRIDGIWLSKRIYNDDGFIHMTNSEFFSNIIQANTELSVKIDYDNLKSVIFEIKKQFDRTIIPLEEKQEIYETIEAIVSNKIFDGLPYLKETLWLLYEDYLRNISSTFSYPWIGDLHYQFGKSVLYLKALVETDNMLLPQSMKYAVIQELIGTMRQTILHVAQANRLFFELPNTHLKNTGSYSKILRTYYGIVKQLLKQAYAIPKKDVQSKIIPFITFDVTPKIMSTVLPQVEECDYIIVNFALPYEALVDIPKYFGLLAHEIFHYIAPNSRAVRNSLVGMIDVSLVIVEIQKRYLKSLLESLGGFSENGIQEDILKNYGEIIHEKSLSYVVTNYEKLTGYIQDYKEDAEWRDYFKALEDVFGRRSSVLVKNDELQKGIFSVFKDVIQVPIEEIITSNIDKKQKEKIKELFAQCNQDEFSQWMECEKPSQRLSRLVSEIKYALREAAADCFMIQILPHNTNLKEYYHLYLSYKELLTDDRADMRQLYRIGIMTDYLFKNITDKLGKVDSIVVIQELEIQLDKKVSLNENDRKYIVACFLKYYEVFKQYRTLIRMYLENLDFSKITNKEFKKLHIKTRELLDGDIVDNFTKSIRYIELFQIQEELEELSKYQEKDNNYERNVVDRIKNEVKIIPFSPIVDEKRYYYAKSVESLIRHLREAAKEITDEESGEPIWFRGHSSYKYKLLPSLYRMKDGRSCFYKEASLREVMEPLFKAFRVKAFGAKEIFQGGADTRIGILASMQHYSVPSNILDWTPAALVALYFAVEKQIVTNEQERKERRTPEVDAEVWLLNPIRLNRARIFLTSRRLDTGKTKEYPIPSIYGDEEQYKEYIPFSIQEEPYNVPVAVYVPHVNERIKAQLGTFTMFSLDSEGTLNKERTGICFEDLCEVQEKYYKAAKEEYKPFLSRVRISKKCVNDLADWLKEIGVSKPGIYPELSNISISLTNEIRSYWENEEK